MHQVWVLVPKSVIVIKWRSALPVVLGGLKQCNLNSPQLTAVTADNAVALPNAFLLVVLGCTARKGGAMQSTDNHG